MKNALIAANVCILCSVVVARAETAEPAPTADTTQAVVAPDAPAKAGEHLESDVISLVGKKGIRWESRNGDFYFRPYLLAIGRTQFHYVDDEGLELSDPDNVVKTGFGIPQAIVGFAGKAFRRIAFNLVINAADAGCPCMLNQAWFNYSVSEPLRIQFGKFKTPMHRAYLVRLGETLLPAPPTSLTTRVNVPYSLNALNPAVATGIDVGLQVSGAIKEKFEYQIGAFNGTGITVNMTPLGAMPLSEGDPTDTEVRRMLIALSSSFNVEANNESSNDFRAACEFALQARRFYWSSEFYLLNMDFVERQRISESLFFYGAYTQAGYLLASVPLQPAVRVEIFDRNSSDENGILYFLSGGINWYILGQNLKVQLMYQYLGRHGHDGAFEANDDDNGLSEHMAIAQFQFSF
jgi:hypothetical protein